MKNLSNTKIINVQHHDRIWSSSTITYIVVASILIIIFGWGISRSSKHEKPFDDNAIATLAFALYLTLGLLMTMMFSHHMSHISAWLLVIGILIPFVIVLFWSVHRYNPKKD